MDLVFDVPDRKAPGYLKRAREALVFQQQMQAGEMTPEKLDALVEYLAQYVSVPEEPEAKRDALWMASEDEFMQLLNAVAGTGGEENPTQPE